jgi:ring-1,2-phenylacetyl-CoA epoxidase subunit PaaC
VRPDLRPLLADALLGLADDEMILAHRDSEWTGHAPILEEDIAFANIALDEMGHAGIWYRLVAELRGEDPDTYPDRLVFHRAPGEFRCIRMVELPKGDWAFTIVRQFLFDSAEIVRLQALGQSHHPPLAKAAAKIAIEERYHDRHLRAWVRRLGLGTEESHSKMQAALDQLWPYTGQLFEPPTSEGELVAAGSFPASETMAAAWVEGAAATLADAGLRMQAGQPGINGGRLQHTEHLEPLLAELQSVARLEPQASW